MTRIGFIGAGRLGVHLAGSLLQGGHELTVHDHDPSAAKPLLELGAAWGASPRAVGELCESAFTCLPSPAAVASVVSGEIGLLQGLAPGSTWIDMSTNDRHELERLAGLAAAAGVASRRRSPAACTRRPRATSRCWSATTPRCSRRTGRCSS